VGATYALPRLAGEIGTYLALTGERLKAADAVLCGAATHHVKSHRFPALLEALCGGDPVNAVLADFMETVGPGEVVPRRRTIDRTLSWDSVEAILAALDREAQKVTDNAEWSASTARNMRRKSPTSLVLALAQMRYGRTHSFEACMAAEFRIVSRIVYGPDMIEGVRAVIVDKDNAPRWTPGDLASIPNDLISQHFAPLRQELELT
jgi:enoyl-CoA hydratase